VEQISDDGYQFCLIDPEGDYDQFKNAVGIGSPGKAPEWEPVIDLLSRPNQNVIVSLLGLSIDDRPQFFAKLLPRIQELRTTAGRPHWLIIDEAHHMLPADWTPASTSLPENLTGIILVTVHPEHISPAALQHVDVIIAIGKDAGKTLEAFARAARVDGPNIRGVDAPAGEALLWQRAHHSGPLQIKTRAGSQEHQRHLRKYAHGELSEDRSFYFRGPEGKLNLRAQNLRMFVQLANGVDEETWMHHLHQRDYSTWMRETIKDETLAAEINNIEEREASDARNSRESVRRAIEQRYTAAP